MKSVTLIINCTLKVYKIPQLKNSMEVQHTLQSYGVSMMLVSAFIV